MKTFGLWAAVVGWHDGDTFYGAVDQGFGIFRAASIVIVHAVTVVDGPAQPMIELVPTRIRCALINAPELSTGSAGGDALAAAVELVPPGVYPVTSYKPDEFGRPLVDLQLEDGRLFSQAMLAAGFAAPYRRESTR